MAAPWGQSDRVRGLGTPRKQDAGRSMARSAESPGLLLLLVSLGAGLAGPGGRQPSAPRPARFLPPAGAKRLGLDQRLQARTPRPDWRRRDLPASWLCLGAALLPGAGRAGTPHLSRPRGFLFVVVGRLLPGHTGRSVDRLRFSFPKLAKSPAQVGKVGSGQLRDLAACLAHSHTRRAKRGS